MDRCAWLGAGAVTLGVGAALVAGAGAAGADTEAGDAADSGSSVSAASADAGRVSAKPKADRSDRDDSGSDDSRSDDSRSEDEAVERQSRSTTATPDEPVANNAPTVTVRSVGSPGFFSPSVRGRLRASDPDRDALSYTGSTTELGTVDVNRFGAFTYTPTKAAQHAAAAPGGPRTDSVGITVDDGAGGVVTTFVIVPIKAANARPTGTVTVAQPDPVTGAVTGRVVGADRDGDVLGFAGSAATGRGSVVVHGDGTFVYTPTAVALARAASPFARRDRFTVIVTDGHGGAATVRVAVRIPAPGSNQAPRPGNPAFVITGIDPDSGRVTGRIDATDPEGFGLTYEPNPVDPGVGTVAVDAAGHFSFVPTVAAREAAHLSPGEDTVEFSTRISDGAAATVVGLAVPILPLAPALPPAAPTPSAQVEAFVAATIGRTVAAPDGSLPGECVSLVKRFLHDVHGVTAGAWGDAVDYRDGGRGGMQMAARGFVWRTDGNPQNGDILVWGSSAGTPVGHIGIWNTGKLFDQNNYGPRASAPRTANYSSYVPPGSLGYWRAA